MVFTVSKVFLLVFYSVTVSLVFNATPGIPAGTAFPSQRREGAQRASEMHCKCLLAPPAGTSGRRDHALLPTTLCVDSSHSRGHSASLASAEAQASDGISGSESTSVRRIHSFS